MTNEATIRKARSLALLTRHGVPYIDHLPAIETADEVQLRAGQEVARRAMCLYAVSGAAINDDSETAMRLLSRWGVSDALTPAERAFLRGRPQHERERTQMSWRCEALVPLMWAIGLYQELWFPNDHTDFVLLTEFWESVPPGYDMGVSTRPVDEVLDEADLIYRYHWSVVEARLQGIEPQGGLHGGVVQERHHALNWLINCDDAEWDDVTTST